MRQKKAVGKWDLLPVAWSSDASLPLRTRSILPFSICGFCEMGRMPAWSHRFLALTSCWLDCPAVGLLQIRTEISMATTQASPKMGLPHGALLFCPSMDLLLRFSAHAYFTHHDYLCDQPAIRRTRLLVAHERNPTKTNDGCLFFSLSFARYPLSAKSLRVRVKPLGRLLGARFGSFFRSIHFV